MARRTTKKEFEIEIPFAESINLHGNRVALEGPQYRTVRVEHKKSTLETCLNILLIVMIIIVSLAIISIAMAGFSFATYRLAQLIM